VDYASLHWTAETALTGSHPDTNRAADYIAAWGAASALHGALSSVKQPAIVSHVVDDLRTRLDQALPSAPQLDHPALVRATDLLRSKLAWIESWTPQMIHGDLSHSNILLSTSGIHGFIDFEFVSFDPIEFNFATLITTLLVRSELDGQTRAAILNQLIQTSGKAPARLLIAVLVRRWLAVMANLTFEGGPKLEVLQRQFQHVSTIVPLVEQSVGRSAGR
jgi:thiamine kinase-like enzyme